jgi:hypothetical protein
MNLETILDPMATLYNGTPYRETTIQKLIARIKGGKPVEAKMIGAITNDKGDLLTYKQAIAHVPLDMQTDDFKKLLDKLTNQAEIDTQPNVGQNVFGQRVVQ